MGEIMLDGFTFHFDDPAEPVDADGVSWTATDVKGIRGAPAPRLSHTPRPGTFGSFRGDSFNDVRAITIGGTIAAPTRFHLRQAEERLAAICSEPERLYELRYSDEYAVRYMYVERNGSFDTVPQTHFTALWEDIPLVAPDPRKFGEWVSTTAPTPSAGSGGVVSNGSGVVSAAPGVDSGTAPVYPQVTVANGGTAPGILVPQFVGPCTNPMFLNVADGRSVMFRGSLPAGESLWVNLSPQYAHNVPGMPVNTFLEGRTMWGASGYYGGGSLTVPNGDFPDFPAGSSASYVFVNGQGVVHARPAYW